MEGITVSDEYIRKVIRKAPISKIDTAIREYIHDSRNREIARRKIMENESYESIAEFYRLSPGQVKNIIKKARRTIFEHLE